MTKRSIEGKGPAGSYDPVGSFFFAENVNHGERLVIFLEKRRELLRLPPGLLTHSRFNARKSRDPGDVEKLAERIKRIGYEETRAVWAVPAGDGYEVFAGGSRLEAAKRAGLHEIPVLVHYGYTDEEISFLADLDNENDEYHKPVPVTDVWAEYARLYEEEGWTQEKIAEVKSVSQKTVSLRLKLHRLPERVKDFIPQGLLTEAHLARIAEVYLEEYFTPWLTPDEAIVELAEKAVRDRKKNGEKSVRSLEADVAEWKAWIAVAKEIYKAGALSFFSPMFESGA